MLSATIIILLFNIEIYSKVLCLHVLYGENLLLLIFKISNELYSKNNTCVA